MSETKFNADFSAPMVVDTQTMEWIASPMVGVDRRMLDRIGDEVARATSIVRYAPGSAFSPHNHDLGEEFLVLEGVFQDEHGDFGPGTYVRNPPGSRHTPASAPGCTIFVKLRQMVADGSEPPVTIDTANGRWLETSTPGHTTQTLFAPDDNRETVTMERLAPGTMLPAQNLTGGEEILVLEGTLLQAGTEHRPGTWLRNPPGAQLDLATGPSQSCMFWAKRGHLPPRL
ncbi:MAG: cupin domain-containing protein [Alphaproteobacteria bacterium]|jgi:anti-sigma factor ChrR (cupin superfamily)